MKRILIKNKKIIKRSLSEDLEQIQKIFKRNEYYSKNDFEHYNKYLLENNFPIKILYKEGEGRLYVASRDIKQSEFLIESKP
jgi:uncharacterized phage-like protein YoqJ